MKKTSRKKCRMVAVLVFVIVLTAACGEHITKGYDRRSSAGEVKDIQFPLEKQITITAMVMEFDRDRTQYIDQLLEQYTNIKIKWTIVPFSDYGTVMDMKLNAGELPDVFQISKSEVQNFYDKRVFVNFTDYIDSMPNLQRWITHTPAIYADSADQYGNMYYLTSFNTSGAVPRMPIYRKDIFEKEGIAPPKTIEELYEALVYLKKLYPDSVPVVNRWGAGNLIERVAVLYQCRPDFYLDNSNLIYQYGPATENFKEAISMLNKFYSADLIDPEFSSISDLEFVERITSGKALFMFSEYLCCLNTEEEGDWVGNGKKNNSDFELAPMYPPSTVVGTGMMDTQSPTNRGNFSVAVNAKSKYVSEILAMLDYQMSDEIINLVNWGVEGETYHTVNGKKLWMVSRETLKEKGVDGRGGIWVPIDQEGMLSRLDPQDAQYSKSAIETAEQFAFYEPKETLTFTEEEKKEIDSIMKPIKNYCSDQYIRFIIGDLNMEKDWDDFLKKISDMGYEKILKIYRDKYEQLPAEQKGLDYDLGV